MFFSRMKNQQKIENLMEHLVNIALIMLIMWSAFKVYRGIVEWEKPKEKTSAHQTVMTNHNFVGNMTPEMWLMINSR
jgi:hypothetical protein